MWIDYLLFALFGASLVAIALYTRRRAGSVSEFMHAGKGGLGGLMTAFAYGTTYFSAVIFIGYAGSFGRQFGLAAVWIGVGNALVGALVAWLVLAERTKRMTKNLSASTMPAFFEARYGSRGLRIVSAVVIFLFLTPYSASVYNGLSVLFERIYGIPGWVMMLFLAAFTALYLVFGGYLATALSDFIQGIVMLVGVALMVFFFLNHENVSWDLSRLVSDKELSWFTFGSESGGLYGSTVSLIALILLTSFGVFALPQTIHKYQSIRDRRAIRQGMIVSTVFALAIGFGAYFTGALSAFFPETAALASDRVIPEMLALVIPAGLSGIIAVLILSASMSTLSSVSLSSASAVTLDLYRTCVKKDATDKETTLVLRIFCFAFILLSVVLAILNEKLGLAAIAYMMGISWGTLAGCFIGPFVLGLVWRRVTAAAAWVSIGTSLGLTVFLTIFLGYDKLGYACTFGEALKAGVGCSPLTGVACMAASMLVTVAVSLLTKPPRQEILDRAFYKPENESV